MKFVYFWELDWSWRQYPSAHISTQIFFVKHKLRTVEHTPNA